MHRWILAVAAAALITASAASADEWSKHYSVSGKPEVVVRSGEGSVEVQPGGAGAVDFQVSSLNWKIPADVRISENQNGNRIEVDVRTPNTHWNWFGSSRRTLRIVVHVPSEADLDLQTGDGSVAISSVSGQIRVDTGDGSITLTNVRGDLKTHTGDGHMNATGLDGLLNADTGDGGMSVQGRFDVLNLRSGDGSIDADAIEGSQPTAPWLLHTGDGSLTIHLPASIRANLDARTGDGNISMGFPVTVSGSLRSNSIHGQVNGGGQEITLQTGDGSIQVVKR